MEVSPLPLREEVPPREAKVAADKLETVRAPYNNMAVKNGYKLSSRYTGGLQFGFLKDKFLGFFGFVVLFFGSMLYNNCYTSK